MDPLHVIDAAEWNAAFSPSQQAVAVDALERGQVLFFPRLACPVSASERRFLTPDVLDRSKNVSYDPASGMMSGSRCDGDDAEQLAGLIGGFSDRANGLLNNLLPGYRGGLRRGRTSLRPAEVAGRVQTWR